MSTRCENWPRVLATFIEQHRDTPFDWQHNNCALFACDWIAQLTGHDPAASLRPGITSALSAARVVAAHGGIEAIADAACAAQGWPSCENTFARRGDVVLYDTDTGPALGVCIGLLSAFAGADGVTFVNTLSTRAAWRIA